MTSRRRPPSVPAQAIWTAAKYWTWTDPRTRKGRWWNERGVVIADWTCNRNGKRVGTTRHYHHNGELASEQVEARGNGTSKQVLYAPTKRGRPSSFYPKAHPNIRRIERTWKAPSKQFPFGSVEHEKYFDADGVLVDHLGRPVAAARKARTSARALARRHVGKRGESFEAALDRAARWSQALKDAGHTDAPREPVRSVAKPATAATIAKLERTLGARLPASYARFLRTVGGVKFYEGASTIAPAQLAAAARKLQATLSTMLADLTPGIHDVRTLPPPTPWKKWTPRAQYLPQDELLCRAWVLVAVDGHQLFAMASHLARAPIFEIRTDDDLALVLVGDFDTWVSQAVSHVIDEVTHVLS